MADHPIKPRRPKKERKPPPPPTPPQPKPWDVPKPSPYGGVSSEDVYTAIGAALSAWEMVERRLAIIFTSLVVPIGDPLPAERAYGSVLTFRGRREMVDAAADAVFHKRPNNTLQKTLRDWLIETNNFATRRNEIAHGVVKRYGLRTTKRLSLFGARDSMPRRTGHYLGPSEYATNKIDLVANRTLAQGDQQPKYLYSPVEIEYLRAHFERLEAEGTKISGDLWSHQAPARARQKP